MEIPAKLLDLMARAQRVTVLTGSGVSVESGVPTFRDAQTGLWANFKPEELATPTAFRRNPRLVWEWYAWRRELVAKVRPNPAHEALVALERRFPHFTLITQNVDGLHQRAGSRAVVELHGNITRTKCFDEGTVVTNWPDTGEVPPPCPRCGGLLRPDVVWFEEMLPEATLSEALARSGDCEVFFSIGTSSVVQPAASLPCHARAHGAVLVEMNPAPTPLTTHADYALTDPAGKILSALVKVIR